MSIVYAVIREDRGHRSVVMVTRDKSLAHETVDNLRLALKGEFAVLPLTLRGVAFTWGYRKMFDRARAELIRLGVIAGSRHHED